MVQTVASTCLGIILICMGLNLIRIIKGPSWADRAVASDGLFLNLVGVAALYSLCIQTPYYFDLVLVFSLLGFVGTVCFSKFLSRGKIIE